MNIAAPPLIALNQMYQCSSQKKTSSKGLRAVEKMTSNNLRAISTKFKCFENFKIKYDKTPCSKLCNQTKKN